MSCLNGHAVNSSADTNPSLNSTHCPKCGERTITACPACGSAIHGFYSVEGVISFKKPWAPEAYCYNCGKPYPWTERNAASLAATLDELDGLDDADREKLKQSIPDILASTPMTGTAVLRFKKAIAAVGAVGGKVLGDAMAKVAAEVVKQQL